RKAEMVQSLTAAGLPMEDLAAAIGRGALSLDFVEQAVYERFTALSDLTFAQVSAQTGVPVELLMVIREAVGGAPANPTDRVREGELEIVPFVELQVSMGFRHIAIERLLRAFGDGMRRMAETESHWWRTEVMEPQLAAGKSASEIWASENEDLLTNRSEMALMSIFRAHQTHTWTATVIEGFETILAQSGSVRRLERPPAMCFLDITGYTRLTQERGDKAAADLAEQLSLLVNRSTVQHGGKPVKWLGDGVMCFFSDPGPGVLAALVMADGVTDAGLPPAHVGLHAGPVIFQGGDYFGQTVNIASRIAEYARPGEVLVSQAVVDAADRAPVAFTDIGEVELKGVAGAVHLHAAHRE
ncbi:MAG: adenylate/guanylate cyclase domain-containing protein, partial [Candidatus Limnocylindria bacterium]